ncbi:MAG: glycerol dehydrogenase, partial [Proteobacteria bacterium]|nr:glycerol dehydrogenase [Pseudomonadota bacterium]
VHLGQLSLSTDDKSALGSVAAAAMEFPFIGNMPLALTPESILAWIIEAHELGLAVAQSIGDAAYKRLHAAST